MTGILYDWGEFLCLSTRFVCVQDKVHLWISFIPNGDCHEFENEELAAIARPCDGISCRKQRGVTYPIHESFWDLLEKHDCIVEKKPEKKLPETDRKFTGKDAVLGLKHHFPDRQLARTVTVGIKSLCFS